MNRICKVIRLTAVLIPALLVSGFACSASTGGSDNTSAAEYAIKVFRNNKQIASLDIAKLQTLPKIPLTASGKSEEGPTLLSALELAGIKDFNKITVSGMIRGRIATTELTLTRAEVTPDVILDFSNRGTAKLAGDSIPFDNWVIDVSEIRIE
jgi:hypothetical protein